MAIDVLVWDDWNRTHIARHQVTPSEVEEVIHGEYVLFPSYKDRLVVIGLTEAGRALHVTLASRGGNTYYVVTARVAVRKEREYFQKQKNDQEVIV